MRLGLSALVLLLAACSHTISVDETVEYKCGEQIVLAEYLDDDSVVIKIDGKNTVLTRSETDSGERFDNSASKMTFIKKDNDGIYLSNNGIIYPMCIEVER